jgi:hypothetical protein
MEHLRGRRAVVHLYHCAERVLQPLDRHGGSAEVKIPIMSPNHYEILRQRLFADLADSQPDDQQLVLIDFIQAGHRCGLDVISEIVDK